MDGFDIVSRSNGVDGIGVPLRYNKDKSGNRCGATSFGFVLILFPLKKPPKMGVKEGGDKQPRHIKDKFFHTKRKANMGSWGVIVREIDYGLSLLRTVKKAYMKQEWLTHVRSMQEELEKHLTS